MKFARPSSWRPIFTFILVREGSVVPVSVGWGEGGIWVDPYRLSEDYLANQPVLSGAAAMVHATPPKSCRSIWISDFHLGTRGCKAHALLDFLRNHEAENLYLVGDIVDGWNAGPSWHWSAAQKAVVEEIAAWRRRGIRVEVLPGNHDDVSLLEALFGIVPNRDQHIHRTAEGRRMLVIHGHQFDGSLASARVWKSNHTYLMAQRINRWYNRDQGETRDRASALAAYLRYRVRRAVEFFSDFDDRPVIEVARRNRVDGVICGHVHRAEQRLIGSIWYINDGDWVHNCTALIEDHHGALSLLRWGDARAAAVTAASDSQSEAS
jgi:UDP-2,3-diacylglucosamine pyrophosphatase LpxH